LFSRCSPEDPDAIAQRFTSDLSDGARTALRASIGREIIRHQASSGRRLKSRRRSGIRFLRHGDGFERPLRVRRAVEGLLGTDPSGHRLGPADYPAWVCCGGRGLTCGVGRTAGDCRVGSGRVDGERHYCGSGASSIRRCDGDRVSTDSESRVCLG